MSFRAMILCCFFFSLSCFARESTDIIVMKNGDHLTCEIKGLHEGVLYIGLPYVIETLSVDWAQVARLQSKQLFFVRMEDGSVYKGTLNTTEDTSKHTIEIKTAAPAESVVVESPRIVGVEVEAKRIFQRFSGGLSFGAIHTKGNQSVQYTITGLAAYPRKRWAAQAGISSNLSAANGTSTTTRNQLNVSAVHLLPWNHYYAGGVGSFLQSSEQNIALQTTIGGSIGRYLMNSNRGTIAVQGGFAWLNGRYNPTATPDFSQNVATGLVEANANLFRFNKTTFTVNALLLPALSEPGRLYFFNNASYYIKITGNLSLNLSFYGNWDTHPPANFSGSDYGSSTGLSWTFGPSLRTSPVSYR